MLKSLVGFTLFAVIFATPIFLHSASKSTSPIVEKKMESSPQGIVTVKPAGAEITKGHSTVKIPSGTIIASPTSNLQGIVTKLTKKLAQEKDSNSTGDITNGTVAPVLNWELFIHGNFSSYFKDVSSPTGVFTNYLFPISRSNDLKVDMHVTDKDSSTTQYEVTLYDLMVTDGKAYTNVLPVGQDFTVTYSKLNPTHLYYLRWKPVDNNQTIDGNFMVHF